MNNIQNLKYNSDTFSYDPSTEPYLRINFDGIEEQEICKKIIDRAVLSKSIIKIISEGETIEEVIEKIKEDEIKEEMSSEKTFKYDFDIRNSKIKREIQEKILLQIHSKFPFKAKVDLKNPERTFILFQSYTKDLKLKKTILGKEIYGKKEEMRYYTKYDLIHRKYLGPTSTDHILSFLISNLAQIKKYQNVIDPFVGT
jgi:tRNA (guanine10-N2)-methyltransferase